MPGLEVAVAGVEGRQADDDALRLVAHHLHAHPAVPARAHNAVMIILYYIILYYIILYYDSNG